MKLKPCPFCGYKPEISEGWSAPGGVGTAWQVTISCKSISNFKIKCPASCQISGYVADWRAGGKKAKDAIREEVIKSWNTRKGK